MTQSTQETLDLLKLAGKAPNDELAKSFTQSGSAVSGITAYDLEPAAKKLYPVITPLRNSIPRVSARGGIQANWRGITGINTAGMSAGVGGGNRGGVIATSTHDYTAAFKGLGLDDYATFEADYAAEGFDDIKALTVEGLLRSLMIQEERIIFGGNSSTGLSTTPTPTVAGSITGGTLSGSGSVNYNVYCVALTLEGYLNASVAGGTTGLVTRTNADASTDTYGGGAAGKSSVATATVASGTTGSVAASVTAVIGAVAYAWY